MTDKTATIRELNDKFRDTFYGGTVVLAHGVRALEPIKLKALLLAVRSFDKFEAGDDPEHDFGAVLFDGANYFWKIDYYGTDMESGSSDPADPAVTTRVLTIMEASEY